jgi:hypothetical protein
MSISEYLSRNPQHNTLGESNNFRRCITSITTRHNSLQSFVISELYKISLLTSKYLSLGAQMQTLIIPSSAVRSSAASAEDLKERKREIQKLLNYAQRVLIVWGRQLAHRMRQRLSAVGPWD